MSKLSQSPRPLKGPTEASLSSGVGGDVEAAILNLLNQLPDAERQSFLRRLSRELPPTPTPRAGNTLSVICSAIEAARTERREWSVPDLKQVVIDQGIPAKPKEIYNAISYLARRGRIRQAGYGRYVLVDYGVGIITTDELDVPPHSDVDD